MRKRIVHLNGLALVQEPSLQAPGVLPGRRQNEISIVTDAYLEWEDGRISGWGTMAELRMEEQRSGAASSSNAEEIDGSGRWVLPGFVDSHTHAVFAAWRETEFSQRIAGATYQEIAAAGGGILNSARVLDQLPEEVLAEDALRRLVALGKTGTTALEIKSGYGLNFEAERKMLRVIRRLKETSPLDIKSTFLGLHAVPRDIPGGKSAYVAAALNDWLPRLVDEGLVDFLDAFVEDGYFDLHDLDLLLEAGQRWNVPVKVHVNQFTELGGVPAAVAAGAWSVDHLEVVGEADAAALAAAWADQAQSPLPHAERPRRTLPVALPACSHFLPLPYTPARMLLDRGVPVGIASDFNPGSSPCSNAFLLWNLACTHLKMTPEEALVGLTLHGAYALGWEQQMGSISVGKQADFVLTHPAPSLAYFPYRFGENHADRVFKKGLEL
jgi:imidazolonepropionase